MSDETEAALKWSEEGSHFRQTSPKESADHARVLAARVRELEAERWKCVGCGLKWRHWNYRYRRDRSYDQ